MTTMIAILTALALTLQCGCQIPPGTQAATSGLGLVAEPLGSAPQAPKLHVGSVATQYSTPTPADAGPSMNRVQLVAPSIDHTATVTSGAVGRELEAAGDVLPRSLEALHSQPEQRE